MYPLIYRILLPVLPRRDPDQVLKAPGKGHREMVAHLLPDLLHGKGGVNNQVDGNEDPFLCQKLLEGFSGGGLQLLTEILCVVVELFRQLIQRQLAVMVVDMIQNYLCYRVRAIMKTLRETALHKS